METMMIITIVSFVLANIFALYCYRYFRLNLFWTDIPIKMKRTFWLIQIIGYSFYGLMFYWEWYWYLTIANVLSIIGIILNWNLYKIMFKE